MNHHKQVACAVMNPEQLNTLLAAQQSLITEISKSLQSQQETNTELGKAATAIYTWVANNQTPPSSSDIPNLTAAIKNFSQQLGQKLDPIPKAINATIQEPTKGTYFKDYGLPTLGTVLSITTLVLGIVLSQNIDNSNTNNITIDTHDDSINPGNSTAPSSSAGYGSGDTTSLFTGLAAWLVLGVIIGAGSYRCFAESEQRENAYARRDRFDSEYEDDMELAPQPEEHVLAHETRQDRVRSEENDDIV